MGRWTLRCVVVGALLLGCGGSEQNPGAKTGLPADDGGSKFAPGSEDAGASATTETCADDLSPKTCTIATEYCVVSKKSRNTGGTSTTGQCLPKPSGCNHCDCAIADARTAFTAVGGGCQNATLVCSVNNDAIVVNCLK